MDSESTLANARKLRDQDRHDDAFVLVRQVLASEPDNADAHWLAGLTLHSLNRRDESVAYLRDTVRLAPKWVPGWAQLGVVLSEQGKVRDGRTALFRALKLNPTDEFSLRQLARLSREEKDYESELNFLLELYSIGNANARDLNAIGIAYFNQRNFWQAIEFYNLSIAAEPSPEPLFNLALIYNHPEVSRDVDATDCLRRALSLRPDYKAAIDKLAGITERLSKLAKNVLGIGETLLPQQDWFRFYLNPFEILGANDTVDLGNFDAKWIQSAKKRIKAEMQLDDGRLEILDSVQFDVNRILEVADELFNEDKKAFHWNVFQTRPLLRFLTRGEVYHFLYSEDYFPIEMLKALDWIDFQEWLSEPFARQYDLILSRALERQALPVVEALFDGRRWVMRKHGDICFAGARRYVSRQLEPLKECAEKAKNDEILLSHVDALLDGVTVVDYRPFRSIIVPLMNLLPEEFRDLQTEAVRLVRNIALSCYNVHGNSEISRSVLHLSKKFHFKNAGLRHQLEDDFEKIEELIKKERQHEARYSLGDNAMHVTKDGVQQGDKFIKVDDIISVRWGVTVSGTQYEPLYDFLLAFRNDNLDVVTFSWRASKDVEKHQEPFNKLINATLFYIVPTLVERLRKKLEEGENLRVGACTMTHHGVSFETKGWFTSKTRQIPWSRVGTNINEGMVQVFDKSDTSINTGFPLKESENVVILQYLANEHSKR
jgi:tetratricopeptide (TPR) repeat protein